MARRTRLVCLFVAVLLVSAGARAEHTREWRQTDFSQFEKGTANGVAVRSDGKFMPAPKFESFADPSLAYIWQLRVDSRGRLFAAGGSDAKVLRFDDSGKATTVFESSELAAQAIALDPKDNLYVATSPDGKVYKVTPDGQKSVFFEPKTKYIWALALDSQGDLFVATGDKGQVFVVTPDGRGNLFYQSDERHARSIAFDAKGNLLIGTEPDGLILRLPVVHKTPDTVPAAGAPFVIYETNKSEVTSLIEDSKGNLYAASVGNKGRASGFPRIAPATIPQAATTIVVSPSGPVMQGQQAVTTPPTTPYPLPSAPAGGAEVVRIAPDGSPSTLWTSGDDLVFSMAFNSAGNLLLGTGDKGTIIELGGNGIYSSVAQTASAQVTSLVTGSAGRIFVATANAGKIFTLGPGYASDGSIESDTFDATIFSHWGRLTWWGENGVMQGKVAFYVRSGNTSSPENNWSSWAGPYKTSGLDEVSCPPARFVQWKAVFLQPDGSGTPTVSWVSLAYQPKNVPPVVDDIAIQDAGIRVVGFSSQANGMSAAMPVQLRMPHPAGTNPSSPPMNAEAAGRHNTEVPPQGFSDKGYQSVLWGAHDDNDDDLIYTIYYRAEGERTWHLLKDKVTQRFYSWDTTSMPDGAYYLKIVASDSPSNPSDQALSAERESDRFEVVNTPPRVENLRAVATASSVMISFEGISPSDAIQLAQYSLDAGDWQVIFPVGQLSDSPKEDYRIRLSEVPSGEHMIAVQVTDRFDNTTTAKATFTVPARASK
jgi:WD40 repeat protein